MPQGRSPTRFNPRAPQGARHQTDRRARIRGRFNPRAPQGARRLIKNLNDTYIEFQSTRSARSATAWLSARNVHTDVSIHALRKERDTDRMGLSRVNLSFNPRAPQGARPRRNPCCLPPAEFQSTRSARSATRIAYELMPYYMFQSTRSARSATAKVDIKGLFCNASITIIRHICVFS